jgi:LysR family transcriptional regulator, glycine cleavage system transcriptional activator
MSQPDEPRVSTPPFPALRAFEAVGRLGGIRRAALDLKLDHTVVSRHLRALEEWAGVPLINRQRDGRVLTDAGAEFHRRISLALQEIAQASADLLVIRGSQLLRIWCMPGLALHWLTARLPHFQALHPEVELSLRPSERSPDFAGHEAEVDIRYLYGDAPIDPSVVSGMARRVLLACPEVFPVASPTLAESLRPLRAVGDLLKATLLHEEDDGYWRSWFAAHEVTCPGHLAGPRLWHAQQAIEAARRSQGIALVNPFLVGDDLASGRLVRVFQVDEGPWVTLGAYVFSARADRWQARAIADFRRWLRAEMGQTVQPSARGSAALIQPPEGNVCAMTDEHMS